MINNLTIAENQLFCSYYHAVIVKEDCWFVTAILKEQDHLCLDRTLDVQTLLYEFFVPPLQEELFCSLMNYFQEKGSITHFQKLSNRLVDLDQL